MAFFDDLKLLAGNWLELKNLDLQSDMLISSVCGFETLNVRANFRKKLWESIRNKILNSPRDTYDVETIAIMKMLLYYKGLGHDQLSLSLELKLREGIRKLRLMKGEGLNPSVSLEIYAVFGGEL